MYQGVPFLLHGEGSASLGCCAVCKCAKHLSLQSANDTKACSSKTYVHCFKRQLKYAQFGLRKVAANFMLPDSIQVQLHCAGWISLLVLLLMETHHLHLEKLYHNCLYSFGANCANTGGQIFLLCVLEDQSLLAFLNIG